MCWVESVAIKRTTDYTIFTEGQGGKIFPWFDQVAMLFAPGMILPPSRPSSGQFTSVLGRYDKVCSMSRFILGFLEQGGSIPSAGKSRALGVRIMGFLDGQRVPCSAADR